MMSAANTKNEDAALVDRIVGCILGVFIGDALGVGVHWQYDLDKLEKDRGYVTGYLDPLPGSFHSGTPDAPGRGKLSAGQLEQQGEISKLLLHSLAERKKLDQDDFHSRFETEVLREESMDGTRQGGKYGWSDKSICELYRDRVVEKKDWKDCVAARNDSTDTIVRAALIAALYFATPHEMCCKAQIHAKALTGDSSVHAHSVAFSCLIAGILQGLPLDKELSAKLYGQAGKALPYSSMRSEKDFDDSFGPYAEPDSLLWFGQIAQGVENCKVEPVHRGIELYGKFCAFFAVVPSAYYSAARFPDDFEQAILCSVNGGGQATMRSSLVGAMLGARVGLKGIPARLVEGLEDYETIVRLARQVATVALERRDSQHQKGNDAWKWPTDGRFSDIGSKTSD